MVSLITIAINRYDGIDEVAQVADCLVDYHDRTWDDQIEDDLESGKLDRLLDEVDLEYEAGLAKAYR